MLNDKIIHLSEARNERRSGLNFVVALVALGALLLAGCTAADRGSRNSSESIVPSANAAVANDGAESVSRSGNTMMSAPAKPPKPESLPVATPRPGDGITPSPWQPPAEVDPAHRDPGDRVEPAPPPPATKPAPSS